MRNLKAVYVLSAISLIAVIGCQRSLPAEPSEGEAPKTKETTVPVQKGAQWTPENVTVSCASADCPSSVGLVFFASSPNAKGMVTLKQCVGFLIAPNEIATAGHCDFTRTMTGWFVPSKSAGAKALRIARSRFTTTPIVEKKTLRAPPDLAILQLSSASSRTPMTLASLDEVAPMRLRRYGSRDVSAEKSSQLRFQIFMETCEARVQNRTAPVSIGGRPQGYFVFNCPAEHGDSGSPLVNPANANVEAVLSGQRPDPESPGGTQTRVTNMRCFENTASPNLNRCHDYSNQELIQRAQDLFKAVETEYWRTWIGQNRWSKDFDYDPLWLRVDGHPQTYLLLPKPTCVRRTWSGAAEFSSVYRVVELKTSPERGNYLATQEEHPFQFEGRPRVDTGMYLLKYQVPTGQNAAVDSSKDLAKIQTGYFEIPECKQMRAGL